LLRDPSAGSNERVTLLDLLPVLVVWVCGAGLVLLWGGYELATSKRRLSASAVVACVGCGVGVAFAWKPIAELNAGGV
ncbi:MAG: hypothetical protein AAGJ54_13295, partial [Planctomycetota bacterium]